MWRSQAEERRAKESPSNKQETSDGEELSGQNVSPGEQEPAGHMTDSIDQKVRLQGRAECKESDPHVTERGEVHCVSGGHIDWVFLP